MRRVSIFIVDAGLDGVSTHAILVAAQLGDPERARATIAALDKRSASQDYGVQCQPATCRPPVAFEGSRYNETDLLDVLTTLTFTADISFVSDHGVATEEHGSAFYAQFLLRLLLPLIRKGDAVAEMFIRSERVGQRELEELVASILKQEIRDRAPNHSTRVKVDLVDSGDACVLIPTVLSEVFNRLLSGTLIDVDILEKYDRIISRVTSVFDGVRGIVYKGPAIKETFLRTASEAGHRSETRSSGALKRSPYRAN
jgi:hypothetical protein